MEQFDTLFANGVKKLQQDIAHWRASLLLGDPAICSAQYGDISSVLEQKLIERLANPSSMSVPWSEVPHVDFNGSTVSYSSLLRIITADALKVIGALHTRLQNSLRTTDSTTNYQALFYRIMKDDFITHCDQLDGNTKTWLDLYACIRSMFYASEPLLDATHYVLEAHQHLRSMHAAYDPTIENPKLQESIRRTKLRIDELAKTILNDFGDSYKSSDLTFNQLDLAAQSLLPDGAIYFGLVPAIDENGSESANPKFDDYFSYVEYLFDKDHSDLVHVIRYFRGDESPDYQLPKRIEFQIENTINLFADETSVDFENGLTNVNLRNRIYQLKFSSEQIKSTLEMYDLDGLFSSNSYSYQLSQERILSLLYHGCDTNHFQSVVFFLDFVNSSRTQDMRYTGGDFDGVRFVDRILSKMTHQILKSGGFVDKSVYDQIFGILRVPTDQIARKQFFSDILPLFARLAQIMESEKRLLLSKGIANASSFGLRIGATLCNVKNIVIGHPLAGIDFTVSGQEVILASRLENYPDDESQDAKKNERPVMSIRVDKKLLYSIHKYLVGKDHEHLDPQVIWQTPEIYFKNTCLNNEVNLKRVVADLPGLGGHTVFGIFTQQ